MRAADMTRGPVTAHFARLAAPLILGDILQQLYNTVDALVIGRCAGQLEFAAVGVAAAVMNLFQFAIVGGCAGASVLFARQYGAGDKAAFRKQHFLMLVAGVPLVAAVSLAGTAALSPLLAVIRTPGSLSPLVKAYLQIVLTGMPLTFLYHLYGAMLRAAGNTRAPLGVLAGSVLLNLALDILFVAHLGWGVKGAAAATAVSQGAAAAACMGMLYRALPELWLRRENCRLEPVMLRRTAYYAFTNALHQCGLYLGKMLVQGAVNSGGTQLITAYTATTRIEGFANSFGSSGTTAASILTAQNLGAKKPERVREIFCKSMLLLGALGAGCAVLMYATANTTAAILLNVGTGAAFENAARYLRVVACFYVFCFTGNAFVGYFNGVGRPSVALLGAVGHIALRVVLSWLWVEKLQLPAVAFATGAGWVLVNLFWCVLYVRQRQKAPATGRAQ